MTMWFDDIDKLFETERKKFDSLFEQMKTSPYAYGYTLHIGEDGIPKIKEFGTKPQLTNEPAIRSTNIDEIVDKDEVRFVLEMAGLEKEDIKIDVVEDTINIKGDRGERHYEEKIPLKYKISGKPKATYKNGILEVIFKKYQPKSQKVDVE
jgi:HSP20 family protein